MKCEEMLSSSGRIGRIQATTPKMNKRPLPDAAERLSRLLCVLAAVSQSRTAVSSGSTFKVPNSMLLGSESRRAIEQRNLLVERGEDLVFYERRRQDAGRDHAGKSLLEHEGFSFHLGLMREARHEVIQLNLADDVARAVAGLA